MMRCENRRNRKVKIHVIALSFETMYTLIAHEKCTDAHLLHMRNVRTPLDRLQE
jgi:hypothetical protein